MMYKVHSSKVGLDSTTGAVNGKLMETTLLTPLQSGTELTHLYENAEPNLN